MEKAFKGLIDKDGNLKIHNAKHFKAFLQEQKTKGVIISIQTEDPKASSFSRIYFESVICLEFVKIFRKQFAEHTTKEIASHRLRSWFAPCRVGDEIRDLADLTQEEMNGLIQHSKFIASKEFDHYIED